MSQQTELPRSRRILWSLLLGTAAYLTNLVPLPLSFGLHFLFGGLFAVLAAILYGPWAGALAGAMSALPTLSLWGHPFAVLSMTLEAWVVGYEARRGRLHHTQSDLGYWLLLGGPLVMVTYTVGADISLMAAGVAALKQAVNGLLNACIASVLALAVSWRTRDRWRLPLEVFLSNLIAFLVLLPLAISLNWTTLESGTQLRNQLSGEAVRAGDVVRSALEREVADQRRTMVDLAHLAEARLAAQPDLAGGLLGEELPPGMKALWLVDGSGKELARLPAGLDDPLPALEQGPAGSVVELPGQLGKTVLLEEPVGLLSRGGTGRVIAALDVDWAGDRILAEIEPLNMEVVVADSTDQVLFADWEGVARQGRFVSDLGEVAFFHAAEQVPVEGTSLQLAEQVVFVHRTEGREFGWQVYVRKPLDVVEYALYQSYQRSYVIALVLITLLLFAIRLVSYIVTRPLVQLASVVVTPEGELTSLPAEHPIWISEVRTVAAHLEEVGGRIRSLIGSLQESQRKLEEHNVELAVANLQLADEAIRDADTGLLNQRAFQRQIGLWVEENRPFTLVLVELEGLQALAATQGHQQGSALVRTLASELHQSAALHGGEAYRLGSARYALLFPTDDERLVDRITRVLALAVAEQADLLRIGAARFPEEGQTAPAILEAAESQLHEVSA